MSTAAAPAAPPLPRALRIQRDALLMPLLVFGYGMQFWDKAVLGSAALFGIVPDLGLQGKRFGTASSIFYLGYLAGAPPMAFLAGRMRLNLFLGASIAAWGAVLMLTPAVQHWQGLYAQRFFLGFIEASVSPGFVAVTRKWYTREEQTVRLGIWYSATGLFSIVSGLTNFGLGQTNTALRPWHILFLVPGAFTIVLGLLFLVLLPPSPSEAPILRLRGYNVFQGERQSALVHAVRANLTGEGTAKLTAHEARKAALDPKMYLFFLIATAIYVTNGAVTVFGPQIVRLQFPSQTSARALALQAPGGAMTAVAIYICIVIARRVRNTRILLLVLSCLPVIAGAAMIWRGDWQTRTPYVGYLLLPIFGAPFVMLLAVASANVVGPTQQAIATAVIFVGYCCGNFASGYILVPAQAPQHYPMTWKIVISVMCATIGLALLLFAVLVRENRIFAARQAEAASSVKGADDGASANETPFEAREKTDADTDSQLSAAAWEEKHRLSFRNQY